MAPIIKIISNFFMVVGLVLLSFLCHKLVTIVFMNDIIFLYLHGTRREIDSSNANSELWKPIFMLLHPVLQKNKRFTFIKQIIIVCYCRRPYKIIKIIKSLNTVTYTDYHHLCRFKGKMNDEKYLPESTASCMCDFRDHAIIKAIIEWN